MKLTEAQMRILEGLMLVNNPPIAASEASERAALVNAGYVEAWLTEPGFDVGSYWALWVWRILPPGRTALAAARQEGGEHG